MALAKKLQELMKSDRKDSNELMTKRMMRDSIELVEKKKGTEK